MASQTSRYLARVFHLGVRQAVHGSGPDLRRDKLNATVEPNPGRFERWHPLTDQGHGPSDVISVNMADDE
jgi:hypothetical protein